MYCKTGKNTLENDGREKKVEEVFMNFLLGMFMKGNERKASGRGEGGMYGPMESSISGEWKRDRMEGSGCFINK